MPTFNTTDPKPGYVYDAAIDTWFPLLGIAPASQVDRWTKTAAGGETSLSGNDDNAVSLAYTSGTEQVYLNGVLLVRGQDYTATNGTTITGLTALAASDVAEVVTFNPSNIITTDAVLSTDFEAKGDLISASAASTPLRLPVGTNGQVLKANSATTSGLEWGSDSTYSEPTIGSTAITSGATVTTIAGLTLTSPIISTITNTGTVTLPTSTDTLVGRATTDTLTNKTLTAPTISGGTLTDSVIKGLEEDVNVVASAATGTINFDIETASVWYYTSNATANHTLNIRYSSSVSLNTALAVGDAITVVWLNTNGVTPYYPNVIQVDGNAVTPKVPAAIAAGNASAIDAYSFTIIKTASATFTVLETQTKFA